MTKQHMEKRMDWAEPKLTWNDETWRHIIFSDEKKFNLDGPDGFHYDWHDLNKEFQFYSKRAYGGGSVMIWAAFSSKGKTPIVFLNGRQSSINYINTLNEHLIPFGQSVDENNWIFQQDNASIHTAGTVKQWFLENDINVLEWPAKSPDLNPIENLWGILARNVYLNKPAYCSVSALKQAIQSEWGKIDENVLKSLSNSMKTCVAACFRNRGKCINY